MPVPACNAREAAPEVLPSVTLLAALSAKREIVLPPPIAVKPPLPDVMVRSPELPPIDVVADPVVLKFAVPVWVTSPKVLRPDTCNDEGVIAPRVSVIAGVVVGLATVPLTPLAVVTETLVTVPPDPVALRVVPVKVSPDPIEISSTIPAPELSRPRRLLAETFWILA